MAEEQDCGQKSGEIELVKRLREQSVRMTVALHWKEHHKSKGMSGEIGAPFSCSSFPVRVVISIASVLSTTSGPATVKGTSRESHFHSLSSPTRPVYRFGVLAYGGVLNDRLTGQSKLRSTNSCDRSWAISGRFPCMVVVGFLMLPCGFARERGPRVEVVCPSPLVPAKVAGENIPLFRGNIPFPEIMT
jgi:hypothetical protein